MTNYYTLTICATRAELDTAIIGTATTDGFKTWAYKDGGSTKYLHVKPDPEKTI